MAGVRFPVFREGKANDLASCGARADLDARKLNGDRGLWQSLEHAVPEKLYHETETFECTREPDIQMLAGRRIPRP